MKLPPPPPFRGFWIFCTNGRLLLQNSQQISRNFHNSTLIVMNLILRASTKKTKRSSGSDGFIRKIHDNIYIHKTEGMNV